MLHSVRISLAIWYLYASFEKEVCGGTTDPGSTTYAAAIFPLLLSSRIIMINLSSNIYLKKCHEPPSIHAETHSILGPSDHPPMETPKNGTYV